MGKCVFPLQPTYYCSCGTKPCEPCPLIAELGFDWDTTPTTARLQGPVYTDGTALCVSGNAATQAQHLCQWERPQPPNANLSTSDRRTEAATRHQRVTPFVPANFSSTGRTAKGKSGVPVGTRVTANNLLQHYRFDIHVSQHFGHSIWPYPIHEVHILQLGELYRNVSTYIYYE
jgi:hypothetical protein